MNRYFLYIAAAVLLMAACTKQHEEEDPVIPVTGITLNPSATVLIVGKTLTLEAAIEPAEATNKTVTWNTSDDRVATVNTEGEVIAVASGTTTITVTANDGGFNATCTVTVKELVIPVSGIITMTTQASMVYLVIAITEDTNNFGNITIDWGDCEVSEVKDAESNSGYGWFGFIHNFLDKSEHRITITGDNINGLACSSQLTALDVSGATALTALQCNYNQLTNLDVSRNIMLTILDCSNNQLTALDVSRNIELIILRCYENQLTTLDVSGATALKELGCSQNQLTALDVSRNTALTTLHCYDNLLSTLDVSRKTALTGLYCYENRLTALDVSQNTALTFLSCSDNQLTASALNDLFRALPSFPKEKDCRINISGNPGENECDCSIAIKKNWVFTDFFGDFKKALVTGFEFLKINIKNKKHEK